MAKKPTFNSVNFAIWIILIAIIFIGLVLLYNKTCTFEKFEEAEKEPEKEPEKKEAVEPKKKSNELDTKEQTIFDKIIKNEVSSADLEKLINAGVVTQNMVEKFLSKLDAKEESKIEPFANFNYAML
jgi:regulator of PEP synthase PpsR (kinase-PPPase family)